jgi:cytochrome c553
MTSESSPAARPRRLRRIAVRAALVASAVACLAALVIVSGLIPVPASSGHWAITSWFLHFTMERSVATHALGIVVPDLDQKRLVLIGAGHYEGGCRFCHGAPGTRMPRVPQASTPHAPALGAHLENYDDAELFYIVRHGIKFTGMPAWPAPTREDEVWAVVAFLRALPKLDGAAYRALVDGGGDLYSAAAPRVVQDKCARCHGAHGQGRGRGAFPRLGGQKLAYLRQAMQAYASGSRHSGIMEPIAASLGTEELQEVVSWYAAQAEPAEEAHARSAQSDVAARIPLCEACHAARDQSHDAFPHLAGQHPDYLAQQLTLLAEGKRGGGPYSELMETVVHWLSERERGALARHFGSATTPAVK